MKKIFIQKIFIVSKLSAFCFGISSFSSPGCCISFILCLLWHPKHSSFVLSGAHLKCLESMGLNFSKIGANLYQG